MPIWRIKPPEDKDKLEWKEKAYRKYLEHIWDSNGIAFPDTSNNKILFNATATQNQNKDSIYTQHFKYFVGRGNNSNLVKQALKRRFWWTSGSREDDEWEEFNFIWTQWRRKPIIKSLKQDKDPLATFTNSSSNQKNGGSNINDDSTTCLTEYSPNDNNSDVEKKGSFERKLTPSFSTSSQNKGNSSRKIKGLTSKNGTSSMSSDPLYDHTLYNHLEGNFHLSNK